MSDLSDFQRDQIVRAPLAGTIETDSSELLDISTGTMIKGIAEYTQSSKKLSRKKNRGRKEKLSERDRRDLKRIIISKQQTTAAIVSIELNQHLNTPVLKIVVKMHLHK
ncbi:hypothetical protein TNCV_2734041 [Trichonephila clavipes]|nr:hypothetical protein TNCV_2734041 [Trichonephila clavipes]